MRFDNASYRVENFSYGLGICMLLVSCLIFLLFAAYLDAVLPKTYGERKSACFCVACCCKRDKKRIEVSARSFEENRFELKYLNRRNYEAVAPEIAALEDTSEHLEVQDLMKVYWNGFEAVRGINLKMYKGQIFSLLGHNGAGKSTIISMLTGLLEKSAGSGQVFGKDLFENRAEVRKSMGICP